MYQMTVITWIIIIFGLITCIPLLIAQLIILIEPKGRKAKDVLIGKGEEWRDNTHFKSAYSLAVADWIIFLPFLVISLIGILLHEFWGYLFLTVAGAIQIYINIFLWVFEKEYVFPAYGALRYYTFIWGHFIYWGVASVIYGMIRVSGFVI